MHKNLEIMMQMAEDYYLQGLEVKAFKLHIDSLKQRLALYKQLRDQEIAIFQPIADDMVRSLPEEDEKKLETVLKHWIAVMRYGAMAMLLNNPEFLQRRLLEWLATPINIHGMQSLERRLYHKLQDRLGEILSSEQIALLNPFLKQAEDTLIKPKSARTETNALI